MREIWHCSFKITLTSKELVSKYHMLERRFDNDRVAGHWASIPKVVTFDSQRNQAHFFSLLRVDIE